MQKMEQNTENQPVKNNSKFNIPGILASLKGKVKSKSKSEGELSTENIEQIKMSLKASQSNNYYIQLDQDSMSYTNPQYQKQQELAYANIPVNYPSSYPNIGGQGLPPYYVPDVDPIGNMLYVKPEDRKSSFEKFIDEVFSTTEKEQFLLDAGYELTNPSSDYRSMDKVIISRKLSDGTIKIITTPLDELFMKEITVKFKNLLLAKATLKLKL